MAPCPHSGLLVEGRCYFCLKVAATNGHKGKLSIEQLRFVGFEPDTGPTGRTDTVRPTAWLQPVNPSNIDKQLDLLEAQRDVAPGWFRLAKEILEDDKSKSKSK